MRYLCLFMLLFAVSLCANAQEEDDDDRLTISGHLIDDIENEPVINATIQLFTLKDSTFVGGTMSDVQGNFSIVAPTNGSYRVKISYVSYETIQREVTLRNGQNAELGTLTMKQESIVLQSAVVTAQAAQVVVKKDTLLFNPEAMRTPEGSAIEELIKRIPGAEVDEDGNITVNGK